jgi:hypothetical protein
MGKINYIMLRNKIAREIEAHYVKRLEEDHVGNSHPWGDMATWEIKDEIIRLVKGVK